MTNIDLSKIIRASDRAKADMEIYTEALTAAVSNFVDYTAKSRGYDSAAHLVSYVNSSVESWKQEAIVFCAWRDAIWLNFFEKLNTGSLNTDQSQHEVLSSLPTIQWP